MTSRVFIQGSLLVFVLSVMGCAPSRGGGGAGEPTLEGNINDPGYIESSCMHGFDEGEDAVLTLPNPQYSKASFGKTYDGSRLQKVARASTRRTAELMRLDGVAVYSIPTAKSDACATLGLLPSAPAGLLSYWRSLKIQGVLGLYLPVNRVREFGQGGPVILLRADTDRYSLMHEYMHHVFTRLREREGRTDEMFLNEYGARAKRIQSLPIPQDGDSPEKVRIYLTAWAEMLDSVLEMLVSFPLEEAAIEVQMTRAVRAGLLDHVTSFNRRNSPAYISSSISNKAKPRLDDMDDLAPLFRDLSVKTGLRDLASRFEALQKQIRALRTEADQILKEYVPASSPHLAQGFVRAGGDAHPPGCTHGQDIDEWSRRRGLDLRTLSEPLRAAR
ncbi:MAG: hypothetical protein KF802_03950 [Bdellovibrionaceae bacterium]|nr:hypothetical protein [Pseudobdellovibrionaceae bacterium]MBX3035171.1 hypothetical protein [Pseudobdellovibrionaceae bacterium]